MKNEERTERNHENRRGTTAKDSRSQCLLCRLTSSIHFYTRNGQRIQSLNSLMTETYYYTRHLNCGVLSIALLSTAINCRA